VDPKSFPPAWYVDPRREARRVDTGVRAGIQDSDLLVGEGVMATRVSTKYYVVVRNDYGDIEDGAEWFVGFLDGVDAAEQAIRDAR
jgi:hypothetical protein